MLNSNEILQLFNKYLDSLVYDRKPAALYEPIQYVLSAGGKRIRPSLRYLFYLLKYLI